MALILLLLKATALLSLALGVTFVMQRASAGSRHLVWLVALGALIALPAVATWSPIHVAVLPQQLVAPVTVAHASSASMAVHSNDVAVQEPPIGSLPSVQAQASVWQRSAAALRQFSLFEWAATTWGAIALALLGWLAFGAWQVRRIVRRSAPLDHADWQGPLYEIADRLGLDAAPRLVRSTDVKMPFACGLVRCTIVLPAESDEWSAERRSAVLIHELGHVRRRDLVGHTLGRLACAFYWFHPMVWAAARRLRAESERACDDLALTFGARPSDYAEHLLDIVTCVRDHATPSIALAMAHRKEFEGRMLAILNPELQRRAPSRAQTISIVGSLAAMAIVISAAAPVARQAVPTRPASQQLVASDPVAPRDPAVPHDAAAPLPLVTPHVGPLHVPEAASQPAYPRPYGTDYQAGAAHPTSADSASRAAALVHALRTDNVASVRRIAAWALKDYSDVATVSGALVSAATDDADASVREMSVWSLEEIDGTAATNVLESAARRDSAESVREMAVWALGTRQDKTAAGMLEAALSSDRSVEVRRTAAWALGQLDLDRVPQAVLGALSNSDNQVRLMSAWAAMQIEDSTALPALRAALRVEKNHETEQAIMRAMIRCGEQPDQMVEWLRSPDPDIRTLAARAMTGANGLDPWPWPWPRPIPIP